MGETVMLDDLHLVVRELVKFDLTWSDGQLKSSLSIKIWLEYTRGELYLCCSDGMYCTL
jgi:hypothetical protein